MFAEAASASSGHQLDLQKVDLEGANDVNKIEFKELGSSFQSLVTQLRFVMAIQAIDSLERFYEKSLGDQMEQMLGV